MGPITIHGVRSCDCIVVGVLVILWSGDYYHPWGRSCDCIVVGVLVIQWSGDYYHPWGSFM